MIHLVALLIGKDKFLEQGSAENPNLTPPPGPIHKLS